ncbi:hypothetical protein PGTUg99_018153 [Puccinia graminis f. sp. tritici]|uniref:Uncharacterized protein n=1 Tax=Puccinia graminis f. sp. tritici TaxID=56615 RepID=A0A5B0SAH4_PUCGR|nr:hypothetical protein PGTUg99_018153 [Puccinia graminis f. sp. tritici]
MVQSGQQDPLQVARLDRVPCTLLKPVEDLLVAQEPEAHCQSILQRQSGLIDHLAPIARRTVRKDRPQVRLRRPLIRELPTHLIEDRVPSLSVSLCVQVRRKRWG